MTQFSQITLNEANRIQSASSIKTLKQCPRKYFYKYVEEMSEGTNIYAIRGKAAHTALEEFFDLKDEQLQIINSQEDKLSTLKAIIRNQFDTAWIEGSHELEDLGMPKGEIIKYHDETIMMLMDYVDYIYEKIKDDFLNGFQRERPTRIEEQVISEKMGVRGFIDVQKEQGDDLIVLDYKTSGKMNMSEHLFQLGMYSLLIQEKHGRLPTKAGIIFLKFKGETRTVDVTQELIDWTYQQICEAHEHTKSADKPDYPRKQSPLCKWRTGQCGFYDYCMKDLE